MYRDRIDLNGIWKFQYDPDNLQQAELIRFEQEAVVPMPWQAQFQELREVAGTAWYLREFQVPPEWCDYSIFFHCGAADYLTKGWLNGHYLGMNEGGYLPFEFELSKYLSFDSANSLVLRVSDYSENLLLNPDSQFSEIPHGKQSWYGPISGIWQSAWLERRSYIHVASTFISPDLNSGHVEVLVKLSGPVGHSTRLIVEVTDPEGTCVATGDIPIPLDDDELDIKLTVKDPMAWSPDEPGLHSLEVRLQEGTAIVDITVETFGFRKIETSHGRLFLNGEPLYLLGALDQAYYPKTIYTPPSVSFLEDQIDKAKALGFNCLRCHIKVPDPRYLDVADRMGMLIWAELPSWQLFTEKTAERARDTLKGMIERDWNHPSIIVWTIINEGWGLELNHDETHRHWIQETYRWAKSLDPNRLIVDNSPCCPNFHMQTDLDDYHFYSNIPDHRHKWNKNISTFVTRPEYTFSKSKEAIRTCREPLIVSEFGNWGLPNIDLLLDEDGNEPWWFETGANWADGAAYPHGVKNRFRRLGLDNVFDDWICFIEATQLQQFEALKYEIETIRSQEEISGYVVTELTDVHWESNGLMDMNRNPRVFSHKFASINKDTVIISTWERVSYWPGEPVQVEIKVAHGAGETIRGSRVQWRLSANNAAGCMEVPDIAPGHVRSVGEISFQSPKLQQPMRCNLEFALLSKDGIILASNDLALSFYPRLYGSNFHGYQLWTPSDYLSEYLSGLGYTVTPDIAEADTVVTQKLNNELLAHVRKGGRLLFVADRPDSDKVEIPGVEIISREGTSWQGDWVSTFAWLRRQGSFERIPGGPYLDMTFERVMPDSVINGLKHLDFEADVHAGMFVGWIHKPVALIAEQRSGKGKLILTTFRLFNEKPLSDPVATALVNSLIAQTLA